MSKCKLLEIFQLLLGFLRILAFGTTSFAIYLLWCEVSETHREAMYKSNGQQPPLSSQQTASINYHTCKQAILDIQPSKASKWDLKWEPPGLAWSTYSTIIDDNKLFKLLSLGWFIMKQFKKWSRRPGSPNKIYSKHFKTHTKITNINEFILFWSFLRWLSYSTRIYLQTLA